MKYIVKADNYVDSLYISPSIVTDSLIEPTPICREADIIRKAHSNLLSSSGPGPPGPPYLLFSHFLLIPQRS